MADDQYVIYDSRASAYEKLGRPKEALRDSKKVIDLVPDRWQGYARSARMFLLLCKHDAALQMAELALNRVNPHDSKRRAELDALKQQIVDTKDRHEERVRRNVSKTTYHAGKLPMEIFADIFKLLVTVDIAQAVLLSHVCRYWRAVAMSTPSLWRTLVLSKRNPAGKTKEWVQRSRGNIQELCLRKRLVESVFPSGNVLDGFRWENLRICRLENPPDFVLRHILKSLSTTNALSSLTEIEYVASKDQRQPFPFRIADPQLQTLTMRNLVLKWEDFHMTRLRNLEITGSVVHRGSHAASLLAPIEEFGFLEANPFLEKLVLRYAALPSLASFTGSFCLSHLVQLELSDVRGQPYSKIDMPSLRVLRINRVVRDADLLLVSVSAHGQILDELSIRNSGVSSQVVLSTLRAMPSLTVFELMNTIGIANDVVEALATWTSPTDRNDTASSLCSTLAPSLTQLNLSASPDLKAGAVIRLVKSRLPLVDDHELGDERVHAKVPLESLTLDGCPLIEPDVLPWIRSKVKRFSCAYASGRDAKWKR